MEPTIINKSAPPVDQILTLLSTYCPSAIQQQIKDHTFNPLTLTAKHLDPKLIEGNLEKIQDLVREILIKQIEKDQRKGWVEGLAKTGFLIKKLKPNKLEDLKLDVQDTARRTAEAQIKAFFNGGKNCHDVFNMETIKSDLRIKDEDFEGGRTSGRQSSKYHKDLADRLGRAHLKKLERNNEATFATVEKTVSSQKARAQLLAYVSKETGTSIDDLDDGAIETYREAFDKAKADAAEAKRVEAEAELLKMLDDGPAPAPSQQIKKKKGKTTKGKGRVKQAQAKGAAFAQPKKKSQAKKPKPLSPKQQTIQRLNGLQGKLPFSSHPRVQRWQTTNHEVMRTFGESYRQEDEENLTYLRNAHNLAGIERVVSDKQLKEQYSYPSSHINHAGVEQKGRKFFASMKSGRKAYSGVIHLGINEESGEIFHAMFTQLENPNFSPSELKRLQVEEIEEEKAEGGWELAGTYQFDIDADDVLHMKTGAKGNNQVHFSFYPLS